MIPAEFRAYACAFLDPADADIEIRCAEQEVIEHIRGVAHRNIGRAAQ
jgi:hypothetical protein